MLEIKVVERRISYKKVNGHIRLSLPGVELVSSKDCYLLKNYNVQKRESRFIFGAEPKLTSKIISAVAGSYIKEVFQKGAVRSEENFGKLHRAILITLIEELFVKIHFNALP